MFILGLIIGLLLGHLIMYMVIFSNFENIMDSWIEESIWEYEKDTRNYNSDSNIHNIEK